MRAFHDDTAGQRGEAYEAAALAAWRASKRAARDGRFKCAPHRAMMRDEDILNVAELKRRKKVPRTSQPPD